MEGPGCSEALDSADNMVEWCPVEDPDGLQGRYNSQHCLGGALEAAMIGRYDEGSVED